MKEKEYPKDLDIALIVKEKTLELTKKVKKEINFDKLHIDQIPIKELYCTTLFISLLSEGYSIGKARFIKDILGLKPMKLYKYDLLHLNKSKKTQFNKALTQNLKKAKGEKVGAGTVLVPVNQTGYFEEFLSVWGIKYKVKEWTVF